MFLLLFLRKAPSDAILPVMLLLGISQAKFVPGHDACLGRLSDAAKGGSTMSSFRSLPVPNMTLMLNI